MNIRFTWSGGSFKTSPGGAMVSSYAWTNTDYTDGSTGTLSFPAYQLSIGFFKSDGTWLGNPSVRAASFSTSSCH